MGIPGATIIDDATVDRMLDDAISPVDAIRHAAFQALLEVGDRDAAALCPGWDRLAALLDSPNAFHRAIGVSVIARAVAGDREGRFDAMFDRYFDALDDASLVVARYAAQNAGRIARAYPLLAPRIVGRLLAVDTSGYPPSRAVIQADVIAALGECAGDGTDLGPVLSYVERQLLSDSPKARAAAKAFLRAERG